MTTHVATGPSATQQATHAEGVTIEEAARLLGCSVNTVRRRVKRGDLRAEREETPQGYTYKVVLPADLAAAKGEEEASHDSEALAEMTRLMEVMQQQLQEKDRQIHELHVLLQQAQNQAQQAQIQARQVLAALPAPRHAWWQRLFPWTRSHHRAIAHGESVSAHAA
ncbi:MAG: helix-turn-helix domain-containing protein [Chloroflexi bacterium]|nr:helix-turn-helix domain-containing protein [Chloroflexota bacterium]